MNTHLNQNRVTIKPRIGSSFDVIDTADGLAVYDGGTLLFVGHEAEPREYTIMRNYYPESFNFCEIFRDAEGCHWIYWRDETEGTDYLTQIPDNNKMRRRQAV